MWHKLALFGGCIFLAIAVFGSIRAYSAKVKDVDLSKTTPIVLVHGTHGTANSFNGMISRITETYGKSTDKVIVLVKKDGTLEYQGTLSNKSKNPFIQVVFENNDAPIDQEATWVATVIKDIQKKYNVTQYNAIGHSNGGLALTTYAEKLADDSAPIMEKLVVIGTPFNDLDGDDNAATTDFTDVANRTTELQQYIDDSTNLDAKLQVLSIAGDLDNNAVSDGVVPVQSALSSRLIFEGNVANYSEEIVTGANAQHSDLHENTTVDGIVADFIY
ncbi:alpha/beta hydrolase [Listeria grandensis]|uniref:alpha/beta hydrolase n=1 Tax=Listeria grandensis TaxID=1494963 RepID=UPI00164E1B8F|nr:alpha/beta hydrolase [Listeria grandensis]MBC6316116.1 alpha/beta hydrolase [Listeria grandensis]